MFKIFQAKGNNEEEDFHLKPREPMFRADQYPRQSPQGKLSSLDTNIMIAVLVTLPVMVYILLGLSIYGPRNANNIAISDLKQARHSILVYQSHFHSLPGVHGDIANLTPTDVIGFPANPSDKSVSGSETKYINYFGTPSGSRFCLVASPYYLRPLDPVYMKSDSDVSYSYKPSGC